MTCGSRDFGSATLSSGRSGGREGIAAGRVIKPPVQIAQTHCGCRFRRSKGSGAPMVVQKAEQRLHRCRCRVRLALSAMDNNISLKMIQLTMKDPLQWIELIKFLNKQLIVLKKVLLIAKCQVTARTVHAASVCAPHAPARFYAQAQKAARVARTAAAAAAASNESRHVRRRMRARETDSGATADRPTHNRSRQISSSTQHVETREFCTEDESRLEVKHSPSVRKFECVVLVEDGRYEAAMNVINRRPRRAYCCCARARESSPVRQGSPNRASVSLCMPVKQFAQPGSYKPVHECIST
ncbi:unnamed protein product [Trichogramma brassicae]|uniref:Uncharacterized protein n=1 Tax=Trichogramma brassicae TaxID=86971 RepID=A0A6H5ITZ6_9HYME|nr:unnamed protein product [Trichogramma brassicae]